MGSNRPEGEEQKQTKPKISKEEQDRLDAVHASYAAFFRNKYGTILKRLDGPDEELEVPQDPGAAVLTTMATRTKLLPDGVYVFSAIGKEAGAHGDAYRDKKNNPLYSVRIQDGHASPHPPLTEMDYLSNKSKFMKNFREQVWGCMAALATGKGVGSFTIDFPTIGRPKPSKYDIDRLNVLLETAQTSKFGINFGPNIQEMIGMLPIETKQRLFSRKFGQQDYLGYAQQLSGLHQQSVGGRILSYGRQADALTHEKEFALDSFFKNPKGEEKFGAERLDGLSGALDKMEARLKSLDGAYAELDAEVDQYQRLLDECKTKAENGEEGAEEKLQEVLEGLNAATDRRDSLYTAIEKEAEKVTKGLDSLENEFRSPEATYDKPQSDETKAADTAKKGELKKRFDDMGSLKSKALGDLPGKRMDETKEKLTKVTTTAQRYEEAFKKQQNNNPRNT